MYYSLIIIGVIVLCISYSNEGCIFILDDPGGLLDQYGGKTNIIKLEHCSMGLPKTTTIPYPLKISVDPPTTQYVEVKIKVRLLNILI